MFRVIIKRTRENNAFGHLVFKMANYFFKPKITNNLIFISNPHFFCDTAFVSSASPNGNKNYQNFHLF